MSAHGGLWYVKILRLGNLFKNQGIWMQMLVSLLKAFLGNGVYYNSNDWPIMSERLHTQQDLQKTAKRRNCRVMEFVCLCLPSQLWVKQTQPAKYGTKLSQLNTRSAVDQVERSLQSCYMCRDIKFDMKLCLEEATK